MEVGLDVEDIGLGGGGFQDLRNLLQYSSAGSSIIRIRDVSDKSPDRSNPGGVPPQGGPMA